MIGSRALLLLLGLLAACESPIATPVITPAASAPSMPAASSAPLAANSAPHAVDETDTATATVQSPPEPREALSAPFSLDYRHVSARYDLRLHFSNGCTSEDSVRCQGAADLLVMEKGGGRTIQTIAVASVMLSLDDHGAVVRERENADHDEETGPLAFADFNFDGEPDIALDVDHAGPYGSRTRAIYLYSPSEKRFVLSSQLSALTQDNIEVAVDAKRKRLVASTKSGCCWHTTIEYIVVHNAPVRVYQFIQDATGDTVVETTERLVAGKWQRTVHRVAREASD